MADSINALNGLGMSLQFEKFAQLAASASKGSSAVRFLGHDSAATVRDVVVTTSDKIGKIGRSVSVKEANNTTRAIFCQSVAAMFGSEDHIPDTVKTAMKPGANDMTSLKSGLMPQSTREYNTGVVTFNGQNIPDGTTGKPYYAPDSDLGDKNPEFAITEIKQEVV